jgi:outer membrane receptor protein involved in Fe transport
VARRGSWWSAAARASLAASACAAPAAAAPLVNIPSGSLAAALALLSAQTGTDIATLEPGLERVAVPAVRGRMDAREALRRMLPPGRFRIVQAGAGLRLVAADPPAASAPAQRIPPPQVAEPDVVITATKTPRRLLTYPASVTVAFAPFAERGRDRGNTDALVQRLPVLQSTALGDGRNKLFVRGVADSGFAGSTPSVTGVYFGDAQLGYLSPAPNLRLVDVRSFEVLGGPQGTLYGAGSLGGVIRITPSPVSLDGVAVAGTAGASIAARGRPGYDAAAMLNLPLAAGMLGARAVAYADRDGGWLRDDAGGWNAVETQGGRLALRLSPGGGWEVDVSGLVQRTRAEDAQYVEGGSAARHRPSGTEPYDNGVELGRLVVRKAIGERAELVSSTAIVWRDWTDRFTALSPAGRPQAYRIARDSVLFSQEVRLSDSWGDEGQWLLGGTYLRSRDSVERALGADDAGATTLDEVTNTTFGVSLFGQAVVPLAPRLTATLGLRGTVSRADGEAAIRSRNQPRVRGDVTRRFDPTLALAWRVADDATVYARVQTGFRTGGLAVARNVGRTAAFAPDALRFAELGFRRQPARPSQPAFNVALGHARWVRVQADLIDRRGRPYTANLGDADILTLEASASWRPVQPLTLSAALLATRARQRVAATLPNAGALQRVTQTPAFSATAGAAWAGQGWNADVELRRIGPSSIAGGDTAPVDQGGFTVVDANLSVPVGPWTVRVSAANLTDVRGNRFAYGNPLSFGRTPQATPLQPATLRVGVDRDW